jgi:tRNA pseudouridine38-40 synthase
MLQTNLLTISFDGRRFAGWQVQKNAVTVMAVFQQALWNLLGQTVDIKGCSRTDSGVHARRFYVSFTADHTIPCDRFPAALNVLLPHSIAALHCRQVDARFHARYDAFGKRYVYKILNATHRNPFWDGLAWHIPRPIDASVVHAQGQALVGCHDFSSFCSAGSSISDRVRTVTGVSVCQNEDVIELSVSGDGFLYNMVRIIAGTLLDIERGVIKKGEIPAILAAKDRRAAGMTAPACGLWLDEVFYDFK